MPKETKGWNKERRAKQAENIRKTKPWKTTTGPKTDTGKSTTAQNALKSGLHSAEINELRRLLRRQKKLLRCIKEQ